MHENSKTEEKGLRVGICIDGKANHTEKNALHVMPLIKKKNNKIFQKHLRQEYIFLSTNGFEERIYTNL